MKKIYTLVSAVVFSGTVTFAQNDVPVSASDNWIGYMNVFELPENGGGYAFGSFWAIPDLKTTLDSATNTVTLQPNFNTYAANPTDSFWVDLGSELGNKEMEASTFVEPGPTFNGQDLTFHGDVLAYTLDTSKYEVFLFVKALDSLNGYADALGGAYMSTLPMSGPFSVTVPGSELPSGLLVQYGFTVKGRNANPLDEAALGSVVLGINTLGIEENEAVQASVYPNPASNELMLSSEAEIQSYEVINITGKVVLSGNSAKVNVASLKEGTYMVRMHTSKGMATTRFVKK